MAEIADRAFNHEHAGITALQPPLHAPSSPPVVPKGFRVNARRQLLGTGQKARGLYSAVFFAFYEDGSLRLYRSLQQPRCRSLGATAVHPSVLVKNCIYVKFVCMCCKRNVRMVLPSHRLQPGDARASPLKPRAKKTCFGVTTLWHVVVTPPCSHVHTSLPAGPPCLAQKKHSGSLPVSTFIGVRTIRMACLRRDSFRVRARTGLRTSGERGSQGAWGRQPSLVGRPGGRRTRSGSVDPRVAGNF